MVGDFDSVDKQSLPEGIRLVLHPVEKNQTDGELALHYAAATGAESVVIYGVLGGKIEHVLCNLALLKLADSLGMKAIAKEPSLTIRYAEGIVCLKTRIGDSVSILPFGGAATVTDSKGLYYPLESLTLLPDDTRGVSNKATAEEISVNIVSGGCLIFHYVK